MPRYTKEQKETMITKQEAIDTAATALALAAKIHGVGVSDIIDLVRALAFLKVKQMRRNAAGEIMQQIERETSLKFNQPDNEKE